MNFVLIRLDLSISFIFFARLELMVAETFGEEENSILETARLVDKRRNLLKRPLCSTFLMELNIADCMPSKNVLKF